MSRKTRPSHLHMHRSGHRGGRILPHRSIFSLQLPLHRLGVGLLIALGCTALLALAQPLVEQAWGAQMVWWMQGLGLAGQFQPTMPGDADLFSLAVPLIDVLLPDVGPAALTVHALIAVALWISAGWLPDPAKPAAYLLRFAVIIHATAIVYFLLWPGSFPHSGISHAAGGLRQNWALMLLTPWLHLCTYYLFPFAFWQRVAVTAATVLFLFVLTPLQYASHAALLSVLGLVAMPVLHLLFGVMVPILGLVALYGWAMSWYDPAPVPGKSA
jgi:hypothetical protein